LNFVANQFLIFKDYCKSY